MTPEMIELYKAVQGRRGEWRQWDDVFHVVHGYGKLVDIDLINGKISPYFENGYEWLGPDDPDLLWLPPVWSEDGQCLWNMVDWGRWDISVFHDGEVSVWRWPSDTIKGYLTTTNTGMPLPEALLRAIGAQEEDHADG